MRTSHYQQAGNDNVIKGVLNELCKVVHEANSNWWKDPHTEKDISRNTGELLMLCVCELAEGMEGHRKNMMDDHLPHRQMLEVELADCVIRIMDICGAYGFDLGGAFVEKMEYNSKRYDHSLEARREADGKKC
jgi:NTP pyrophosphatase (non-canonical NTP hydrolase)